MKINTTIGGVSTTTSKDKLTKTKQNPAGEQAGGTDSVSIGARSANLAAAESSLSDIPVADAGKVAAVSQALSDGSFTVDSEVVADRMIESAKENLRAQK